jgi:hypothetical protein
MYYYDTDNYVNGHSISLPGNLTNMAHILARLTLLLIGTTQMHNLLLGGHKVTFLLFAGDY